MQHLIGRRNEEIEGVGNGVSKAAENEHRNTQHQRQHLSFAGKLYSSRHDEAATDGKQETSPRPLIQSPCKDLGSRFHTIGLGIGNEPSRKQTTHNITEKYCEQHRPVALTANEACCARIELQTVIDNGSQAESEEHGTSHTTDTKINHTSDGDADTCKNSGRKNFLEHCLS